MLVGPLAPAGSAASLTPPPARLAEADVITAALGTGGDPTFEAGEGERLAAASRRASPAARSALLQSQTAYSHLTASQARGALAQLLTGLVETPAGGVPNLNPGDRVTGFPTANTASVVLSNGAHAVIESQEPLTTTSLHQPRKPIDLALATTADGFVPRTTLAPLSIPRNASESITLTSTGVSLTPLAADGAPAHAEGALDGASVIYANTAPDTDTLVKALTNGFQADSILRSATSPHSLTYRVGMPAGATLHHHHGSLTATILTQGKVLATLAAPSAYDAAGSPVPLTLSTTGDTITVSVAVPPNSYRFPIVIDPTVSDTETGCGSPWEFYNAAGLGFTPNNCGFGHPSTPGAQGEWAYYYYITKGASRVYSYFAKASLEQGSNDTASIFITSEKAHAENKYEAGPTALTTAYPYDEVTICAEAGCAVPSEAAMNGHETNGAFLEANVVGAQANHYLMHVATNSSAVGVVQYAAPTAKWDTTSETITEEEPRYNKGYVRTGPNALYGGGRWIKDSEKEGLEQGRLSIEATDPGIGIDRVEWKSPTEPKWQPEHYTGQGGLEVNAGPYAVGNCNGAQCGSCTGAHCAGEPPVGMFPYGLPEGEDVVEGRMLNATGLSSTVSTKVKIDNQAPTNVTVAGIAANAEFSQAERERHLSATATDGSGKTISSGIASLTMSVDGIPIGPSSGTCAPGPCTATGEWTLNTETIGPGSHTLLVTAVDGAGNTATSTEIPFTVHNSAPLSVAPGKVNPVSGELDLSATDASITTGALQLTVSRSVSSRHLASGEEGLLGSPWRLTVGGQQTIIGNPGAASMTLTSSEGAATDFVRGTGGVYKSPTGDAGVTLKTGKVGTEEALLLQSGGSVTTFVRPDTTHEFAVWRPITTSGLGGTTGMTFTWQVVEINGSWETRPLEALAPVPAGVSCTPTLTKGCRALTFIYAETGKPGEEPSEWGAYAGRLSTISFTGWDPAKSAVTTTAVAQYAYNAKGQLRSEWDPRITPTLKNIFGYDPEGHVSSVQAPSQQPFLMTYGTIASDPSPGRLLSVTRPPAATPIGTGTTMKNAVPPTLSTSSPVMGTAISVATPGQWTGTPLISGYQWYRCNVVGAECTAIAGATNDTYTPILPDNGHALLAYVSAASAAGTATAPTVATKPVPVAAPTSTLQFGTAGANADQFSAPAATATTPSGAIWVTDATNNRLEEFSATGGFIETVGWGVTNGKAELQTCTETCQAGIAGSGAGQFKNPQGIAVNPRSGNIYVVDGGNNRVDELTPAAAPITSFNGQPNGELQTPHGIAIDSSGNVWVTETGYNRVREFSASGVSLLTFGGTGTKLGQFTTPTGIAFAAGSVYVIESGDGRIQQFTTAGVAVHEFAGPGSGKGLFTKASGIATDPLNGDLYATDAGGNRVEAFTPEGAFVEEFGTASNFKGPAGLAISPLSGALFIADEQNNRVDVWTPAGTMQEPVQAPPTLGTSAIETLDYEVPVSGTGAPYSLSSTETAKWGQTDNPVEATALFPADEPMGWPAKDYRRATVYYRDTHNREVNVARASGGISTTEYNATNNVVRTLSPGARKSAVEAGAASVADSHLWDTQNTYSTEGTELLSSLGPEHNVRLPNGTQAEAREFTHYFYDEGAPEVGGPYELITKTVTGALVAGKEEDVHTTTTSYGGQAGLGWRLHKPTASTLNPEGLKIVQSAAYDPVSGDVTETRHPGAGAPGEAPGYTQVRELAKASKAIASNALNDVFILGTTTTEVAPNGTTIRTMGTPAGSRGVAYDPAKSRVWLTVTNSAHSYLHGLTVEGKTFEHDIVPTSEEEADGEVEENMFTEPAAIAANNESGIWTTDTATDKIMMVAQEKVGSQEGHYVTRHEWGGPGTGQNQFKEPQGITVGAEGNIYIADTGNNRVVEYTAKGVYVNTIATSATVKAPHGLATDSEGHIWVADTGNNRIIELSTEGKLLQSFGTVGTGENQLKEPQGVTVDSHNNVWVADTGNTRTTEWSPNGTGYEGTGKASPHATQTIYYSTEANSTVPACGLHPEWAGLLCQTQPAKQPEGSLPKLPVNDTTYNVWDEPEVETETVSTTTRTTTTEHDGAGRVTKVAVASSIGTVTPPVTNVYSTTTGALTKQESVSEGQTLTTSQSINSLGLLESYTDADGNTSTYKYDIDARPESTSDGKGTETYSYAGSGYMAKFVDTAAGTFTLTENLEGGLRTLAYPNGMTATYTENRLGEVTQLEYVKTTNCTTNCTWFSETLVPTIHSQTSTDTTSFGSTSNTFDAAGRLLQVQETPAGEGCTTRIYGYDVDSNRTSLTTRAPGTGGKCATEGGTSELHGYDESDRLLDTGATYNAFGETASVPATDAGGNVLSSGYYSDSQLATQAQNGETLSYKLDPAGRTRETIATGKTTSDAIDHYASGSESPAWTVEPASGTWTRYIQTPIGLGAIQTNGETPVLQVSNLHGDIVATAELSPTATKLLSTGKQSTEYGVPKTAPAKYAWLGAPERGTELASGVVAMGERSYVPQLGRFLQTDPVSGASSNPYTLGHGDPLDETDLSGAAGESGGPPPWAIEAGAKLEEEGIANRVAEEAAAQRAAERLAAEERAAEAAQWQYFNNTNSAESGAQGGVFYEESPSGGAVAVIASDKGWLCTLGGAVVAAGVFALLVPGAQGGGVTAILVGGAFTAGCEVSQTNNPVFLSGLPHESSVGTNCINEFTVSKRTGRRNHKIYACETYYA